MAHGHAMVHPAHNSGPMAEAGQGPPGAPGPPGPPAAAQQPKQGTGGPKKLVQTNLLGAWAKAQPISAEERAKREAAKQAQATPQVQGLGLQGMQVHGLQARMSGPRGVETGGWAEAFEPRASSWVVLQV